MSSSSTSRFRRQAGALLKQHEEFLELLTLAYETVRTDPLNKSRKYRIKKLAHLPAGEGRFRLRLRRFRFRYDVEGSKVVLTFCGLRREDTYKKS